jgi:hypothetical protein
MGLLLGGVRLMLMMIMLSDNAYYRENNQRHDS